MEPYLPQKDIDKETLTIGRDFFEHLLNCLASQKFVGEGPQNGDSLSVGKESYDKTQEEMQRCIDKAYHLGRFILSLESKAETFRKELREKYIEILGITNIDEFIENDKKLFPNDENIHFKWVQIVGQEILMWIDLNTTHHSNAKVDFDKMTMEKAQVSVESFHYITVRRGFTPKMIEFTRNVLIELGIGERLKSDYFLKPSIER